MLIMLCEKFDGNLLTILIGYSQKTIWLNFGGQDVEHRPLGVKCENVEIILGYMVVGLIKLATCKTM